MERLEKQQVSSKKAEISFKASLKTNIGLKRVFFIFFLREHNKSIVE